MIADEVSRPSGDSPMSIVARPAWHPPRGEGVLLGRRLSPELRLPFPIVAAIANFGVWQDASKPGSGRSRRLLPDALSLQRLASLDQARQHTRTRADRADVADVS